MKRAKNNMLDIRGASIFAKMLANENIAVYQDAKASTASFNLEARIMTLPTWDVPDSVHKMLIAHEISHALFTPSKEWVASIKEFEDNIDKSFDFHKKNSHMKLFHGIVNIIEDIRIDKLIQRKYPGTAKYYRDAYHFMIDNPVTNKYDAADSRYFFPEKEKIDDTPFLARMNTYGKAVLQGKTGLKIKFDNVEMVFINRAAVVETFADIAPIARDIYNYIVEKGEDSSEMDSLMSILIAQILDMIKEKDSTRDFKENPISLDDLGDFLDEKLKEFQKDSKKLEQLESLDPVEREKKILANRKKAEDKNNSVFVIRRINPTDIVRSRRSENDRGTSYIDVPDKKVVSFMRNQFNRYKNAKRLQNSRYTDSGELDMTSLHSYKFNPRIFTKEREVGRQKNHGVIVLVDGSSSMSDVMSDVAVQVYNMFLFCMFEKIPFVSYVFNTGYGGTGPNIEKSTGGYVLTEYFKTRKDAVGDFHAMSNAARGSTPLSSSLVGLISVAEDFQARNKVDILNVMVITDGDCDRSHLQYSQYRHEASNITVTSGLSPTGKDDSQNALMKIISDVTRANVLTFRINESKSELTITRDVGGSKVHFDVPSGSLSVNDTAKSRLFLSTLIKEMN